MKMQDITKNLWLTIGVLVLGFIFFNYVSYGIGIKEWFLGKPVPSPVGVVCGSGTYFDGQECKLQNIIYIFIAAVVIIAVYFFMLQKRETEWREQWDCLERAYWQGGLRNCGWDFQKLDKRTVQFHRIPAFDAYLAVGKLRDNTRLYSTLISGKDSFGTVLHEWDYGLEWRSVMVLLKKGVTLEEAYQKIEEVKRNVGEAKEEVSV